MTPPNIGTRESVVIDFTALLLDTLRFTDGEFVSLAYEDTAGLFHTAVMAPADAAGCADTLPRTANTYFGVNPVTGPPRTNCGRGKEADVTRLTALWCDLDVKLGGCPSLDVARAIVANLSIILGTRPSVTVDSGHGLHAYWPISDGQILDGGTAPARALLRRWGRLVALVAANLFVTVDNVFDLPRMMRLPGSMNNKSSGNGAVPLPVTAHADTGGPLTIAEIDERLTEVGIDQDDGDADTDTEVVSAPAEWTWAASTCGYVNRMIDGWATDTPPARHPWLVSGYTRLACAHRLGCLTADDHRRGRQVLDDRFTELVRTTEPRRDPRRFEIAGQKHSAREYGIARAAAKTDAAARAELGDHDHPAAGSQGEADTGKTGKTDIAGMPKLWDATELKPAAQPRWLARDRIPRAAVTLLVGDEGIGKSLLWVWVVAAVTTGEALPAFGIPAREPSPVIIVITEDAWQDTVLPRLQVAGADLNMIRVICTEEDGSGSPVFPRDLFLIAEADPKPALIVVDAWLDTVSAALSVRDPQQARQALHPFKEIATTTDAAVMLLCHTNRVATPNARDRYGATGELRKKARMTLYAQTDEDGCLLAGPEKMNTARPIPASKFTITAVQHFEPSEDHDGTVPLLSYAGDSELTAREHLDENYAADHDAGVGDDPLAWLAAFLAAGPRWVAEIYSAAEALGYSKDKAKRAKRKLHAESAHDGDSDAWFWRLPQQQGSTPPPYVAPLLPCSLATRSSFQGSASSSQESKGANGETRDTECSLAPDDEERPPRLGELCAACHEQPLWSAQSIRLGVCGACQQKAKGGTA